MVKAWLLPASGSPYVRLGAGAGHPEVEAITVVVRGARLGRRLDGGPEWLFQKTLWNSRESLCRTGSAAVRGSF